MLGVGPLDLHFPVGLGATVDQVLQGLSGVDRDVTVRMGAVLLITVNIQYPGVSWESVAQLQQWFNRCV